MIVEANGLYETRSGLCMWVRAYTGKNGFPDRKAYPFTGKSAPEGYKYAYMVDGRISQGSDNEYDLVRFISADEPIYLQDGKRYRNRLGEIVTVRSCVLVQNIYGFKSQSGGVIRCYTINGCTENLLRPHATDLVAEVSSLAMEAPKPAILSNAVKVLLQALAGGRELQQKSAGWVTVASHDALAAMSNPNFEAEYWRVEPRNPVVWAAVFVGGGRLVLSTGHNKREAALDYVHRERPPLQTTFAGLVCITYDEDGKLLSSVHEQL